MATIKRIQEWHEISDLPDADLLVEICLIDESRVMASTDGDGNWFNEYGSPIHEHQIDMFRYWANPTSPLDKYTVSRAINGISINGDEYILDENGKVRRFDLTEALDLVGAHSVEEAEKEYGIFIKPAEDAE